MGTLLALEVEAASREAALRASEAAVGAVERAESRLSTWRSGSELSRLNSQPAGRPLEISPMLAADLRLARRIREGTGGAFDPGIGRLVEAWGLRSGGRLPSDAEIEAALVPRGLVSLRIEGSTATRLHPDLVVEEGGFGKGIALDEALAALRLAGAVRAVLDFGGEVAVLGEGPFSLAVADPADRSRTVLALAIDAGAVATSGNSERGIVAGGERRSHILDPRTGRPAPDFGSLTVWARDAATADGLSTGLFVLGPDGALAWAAAHPGIDVLVLEREGERLRARATSGLEGRLTALVPEVSIQTRPSGEPPAAPEGENRMGPIRPRSAPLTPAAD